jgi:hypothetical protein
MEILVLECPWDSESVEGLSVWPFFKEFANAARTKAYFQAFNDKKSLKHWIDVFDRKAGSSKKLLYIAAHGEDGRISGLKNSINATTILNMFAECESIDYVYFGSCFFGTDRNLASLLDANNNLKWVTGYTAPVDWINSTLFDLLFIRRVLIREDEDKGRSQHTMALDFIEGEAAGLSSKLSFNFNYRYDNKIFNLHRKNIT